MPHKDKANGYKYQKAWQAKNKERVNAYKRDYCSRIRQQILDFYGRVCASCSHDDERVLQVDHVFNDGAEERRRFGKRIPALWKRIQANPERYQLLCANCNWLKRYEQGLPALPRTSLPLGEVA